MIDVYFYTSINSSDGITTVCLLSDQDKFVNDSVIIMNKVFYLKFHFLLIERERKQKSDKYWKFGS